MPGIRTRCEFCGLQYGGNHGIKLYTPSINGRTKPFECMCGAVYNQKTGRFEKVSQ